MNVNVEGTNDLLRGQTVPERSRVMNKIQNYNKQIYVYEV